MQGHDVSEDVVMAELMAKHQTVMSVLSSRQATMQVVKGFWLRGDVRGALTALLQSSGTSTLTPSSFHCVVAASEAGSQNMHTGSWQRILHSTLLLCWKDD